MAMAFYAGAFIVPFLMIFAVTGVIMLILTATSNQLGNVRHILLIGFATV